MRGYCGIALFEPKHLVNYANILRSAQAFDVDLILLIGDRYDGSLAADTGKSWRHIPTLRFPDAADFLAHLPDGATLVPVEVGAARPLPGYRHPERAIYLFGGEDRTLPPALLAAGPGVRIDTQICLNQAIAASLVLYDRVAKYATRGSAPTPQEAP